MLANRSTLVLMLLWAAACSEAPVALPEPAGVQVAASAMTLVVGDVAPVGAQVVDGSGRPIRGLGLVFGSDNPSAATVDANGTVRGLAPGTASVSARHGTLAATVRVTVVRDDRNEVSAVDVLADSLVSDVRAGVRLLAVRAMNGWGQAVCPQLAFRSSDASVATARAGGPCRMEIVPAFAGWTWITAEVDGRADSVRVRVTRSGAIAWFSTRPATELLLAGAALAYTVKVLDQASRPVAGQWVNLDASVGSLSTTGAATGEDGTLSLTWTVPLELRRWGQTHWIAVRAALANGTVVSRADTVFLNGRSVEEVILYRRVSGAFAPLTEASITIPPYYSASLGASGLDVYGNVSVTDITFSADGRAGPLPPSYWGCGGPAGSLDPVSGVEFTCFESFSSDTVTFTATAANGRHKSVLVIFP
jgi:hypothetical protein